VDLPASDHPYVAVVLLSWNGREDTLGCLRSFEQVDYRPLKLIVVDNGSTDGTGEAVRAAFPEVEVIRVESNLGFAEGNNVGLRHALELGAEFAFVLNNDTEIERETIPALVEEAARRPDAGALCSKIFYADPPDLIWFAGASFDPSRGYNGRMTGYREHDSERFSEVSQTDRACGAAMLVPRRVLEETGLFDSDLFFYQEDTDWSLRAGLEGYRHYVIPASRVWHRISVTSGGENSPTTLYYGMRNTLEVCERYAPLGRLATRRRRLILLTVHVIQALRSASKREGLRAVRDGWHDFRHRRFGSRPARAMRNPNRSAAARAVLAGRRDFRSDRLGQREEKTPSTSLLLRRDPGLWLLLHLRPPGDSRGDHHGRCSVCGANTRFVRNSWVLPRELARVAPAGLADRESQFCGLCGSSLRVRALADVLLEHYAGDARSIADLVKEEHFRLLDIAELNSIGRMHPLLAPLSRLTYTEYPEQDIQALTFPDASFDLVLMSETLEHVPDFRRALAEVRRVLRPGGRHVFTVPLDPRLERTRSREGMAPIYHGRGGGPFALVQRRNDMLVYTDFGLDIPDLLREAGFKTEVHGSGIETVYCAVAR